mmetsp:Transcript_13016/g.31006  ORF Transcript_13016/g.31006 Transcript_13016/m.31006 type:complete len:601 (-) Transcript_13016:189-1991(-)
MNGTDEDSQCPAFPKAAPSETPDENGLLEAPWPTGPQQLSSVEVGLAQAMQSARQHVELLESQLRYIEAQQRFLLADKRATATANKAEGEDAQNMMKMMKSQSVDEANGVLTPEVATSESEEEPKSSSKKGRPERSRRRTGGIAQDHELEMIRKRLAEYNARANSVLGSRVDLKCDGGCSLSCLVASPLFDAVAAFIILFNSFIVGWEVEWGTRNTQGNAVIQAFSSFCNVFFLLEVLLRMCVFRMDFFLNRDGRAWNFFDLVLVMLGVVDEVSSITAGADPSSNAVGSAKMLKMLRILRVFRVFRFFRPLARLALMIMDSIRSLLWAMFMLALITYAFAVSLTAQASIWLVEQVDTSQLGWYESLADHADPDVRTIQKNFGSLAWTLYTLAQTTLAGVSWHQVCDPLIKIGWLPVCLLLIYISFTLLAVLNVITGVFVDNAFRSADKQHVDIIQKEVDKKEECVSLIQAFFKAVDVNENGEISLDELRFFLDDATMDAFFRVLGFDVYDKHRFMELLDVDDSGAVSYEEFLEGCMRYRGVAQGVDVHIVIRHLSRLQSSVGKLSTAVKGLTDANKPMNPFAPLAAPLPALPRKRFVALI